MIIGTAGHIDHGKSALIEALTGTPMDRLLEERQRGITIDLNFAPFELGNGRLAGVVDVPGHEDFVRTMVAGASGIDIVLLVVSADEGIKPQTREHLAIAEQLGIARGIPVLTKTDLVDAEWAGLLGLEIAEWLRGSPIAFEPPIMVSALTRTGIEELRAEITRLASSVPVRNSEDLFRLPVDRAFSVAGIGTVVTGTAWSGTVSPGDQVLIMPARKTARVRTVQMHGHDASRAQPGMRVALGLAGIDREAIRRGDTVTRADGPWESTLALDVQLDLLPGASRALITRSRVRLHLGTSEILARVYPRSRIEPGKEGLARLALESPAVARGGDRFVIRSYSPVFTIGGGRVVDPLPPRRKAAWPEGMEREGIEDRLQALISRRPSGTRDDQLPVLLGLPLEDCRILMEKSTAFRLTEDHWVGEDAVAGLATAVTGALEAFHRTRPSDRGMPLGELRQGLRSAPWLVNAVLADLERGGVIVAAEGVARLAKFAPRVSGGDDQVDRVVSHLHRAGLTPPSTGELTASLGIGDLSATLRLAAREHRLEAVERDRYYALEPLDLFLAALVELGKGGTITPGQLRDRLGISRKFLIPLLEWADAKGITVRAGDGRRLREGYQLPRTHPVP